jgi:hypothetical protein
METKSDQSVCWVVSPEDGLIKLDEASGPVFEYGKPKRNKEGDKSLRSHV